MTKKTSHDRIPSDTQDRRNALTREDNRGEHNSGRWERTAWALPVRSFGTSPHLPYRSRARKFCQPLEIRRFSGFAAHLPRALDCLLRSPARVANHCRKSFVFLANFISREMKIIQPSLRPPVPKCLAIVSTPPEPASTATANATEWQKMALPEFRKHVAPHSVQPPFAFANRVLAPARRCEGSGQLF